MDRSECDVPEVAHKLLKRVHSLGQRDDDVDEDAAGVHSLTFHLHNGTEWPEEDQLCEVPWVVPFKHQLINSPPVPLCSGQPCDRCTNKHPNIKYMTAVRYLHILRFCIST